MLEVDVDVAAALQILFDPACPGRKTLRGVRVAAEAKVDEGAASQWSWFLLPITVNEGGSHSLDQTRDVRGVPGPVTELVRDAPVRGLQRGDPLDPARLVGRGRWELEEDRAELVAKALGFEGKDPHRFLEVWHPSVVRDSAMGFHRKTK